jgi:hypothetical protein
MNFEFLSDDQNGFAEDIRLATIVLEGGETTDVAHKLALSVLGYVRLGLLKTALRIKQAEEAERAQLAMGGLTDDR